MLTNLNGSLTWPTLFLPLIIDPVLRVWVQLKEGKGSVTPDYLNGVSRDYLNGCCCCCCFCEQHKRSVVGTFIFCAL